MIRRKDSSCFGAAINRGSSGSVKGCKVFCGSECQALIVFM